MGLHRATFFVVGSKCFRLTLLLRGGRMGLRQAMLFAS